MEIFNEHGQFTSKAFPQIFEAALRKTPIKDQAIKLAQKHVAHKLKVALDAGVIAKFSVECKGLSLLVEMEFSPVLSQVTSKDGKHKFNINTIQRISRTYSLEDTAREMGYRAMLSTLGPDAPRH